MRKEELSISGALFFFLLLIVISLNGSIGDSIYGQYNNLEFWKNILIAAHGMLMDLFFVGIVFVYILGRKEKRKYIQKLLNKINFNRHIHTLEVGYLLVAVIEELNKDKITKFDLHQISFSGIIFPKVDLTDSSIHATNFSESNLKNVCFVSTIGERTIYDKTRMKNVCFNKSKFIRVKFTNTIANNSYFRKCTIIKSNFNGSNFNNADFRNSTISNSFFEKSCLRNADFRDCIFDKGVTFKDCDLQSAKFVGAKNIPLDEIILAKSLKKAKFDKDISDKLKKLGAKL